MIIEFLKRHICIYKLICQALVCSEEDCQEDEFRSRFSPDLSVICPTFQVEKTCLISDILYLLLYWSKQITKRISIKTTWIPLIHFKDQTFLFSNQVMSHNFRWRGNSDLYSIPHYSIAVHSVVHFHVGFGL